MTKKVSARTALAAQRKSQAFELYLAGHSYREIAAAMGVSFQGVGKMIKQVMADHARIQDDFALQHKTTNVLRLEKLILSAFPMALKGDLDAHETVRKHIAEQNKMLGAHAPQKAEISGPNGGAIGVLAIPHTLEVGDWTTTAIAQSEGEQDAVVKLIEG